MNMLDRARQVRGLFYGFRSVARSMIRLRKVYGLRDDLEAAIRGKGLDSIIFLYAESISSLASLERAEEEALFEAISLWLGAAGFWPDMGSGTVAEGCLTCGVRGGHAGCCPEQDEPPYEPAPLEPDPPKTKPEFDAPCFECGGFEAHVKGCPEIKPLYVGACFGCKSAWATETPITCCPKCGAVPKPPTPSHGKTGEEPN